ncbi:FAD-dependent oxidoreductase [Roseateles cellulosilyticus]|uniref:FAD-dependent oxidoreductase n=1 Tax=Pelomonas cellulosilytica TaxID=2906762 RepID=A0ABS8XYX6_9BURK|nr:FAD-dependent oxidoreductase [Pelomonas sp. P8]MCE4555944.1 FAD-dependent oxidoreductase [Pelomonas sp. P8]
MRNVAIAGAGVIGRLLAWQLARSGHRVTVIDPATGPDAPGPAALVAAGMLSPVAEREHAGPEVAALGWRSLQLWPRIAQALGRPELVRVDGSLLLAHGSDLGAAQRVLARLSDGPEPLDRAALARLEPSLAPGLKAWLLPGEGQVLPREMLVALAEQAPGVDWRWGRHAETVQPHRIALDDGSHVDVDLAIDTRGLGARPDVVGLRGVRGEILWLHAPGVPLHRPVRLMHPRHRVYLVPRPGDLVVVGASEVESEDRSPVSLRSAVELLAAAHSVLPALAEARIVQLDTHLRPAFADHRPRIDAAAGLLRINGLFRHGWLLAPALAEDALRHA